MRSYELVLVLKPALSVAQRKKIIDAVLDLLKALKIVKKEEVGEKVLSYPIKKQKEGFYMDLVVEGAIIPVDLEKKILNNEDILRHLLLRKK